MKKETCQIKNEKELLILAKKILSSLKESRLITLSGSLGSGKTTFTKYLAKALNIKQKITSPSFVLMKIYKLPKKIKNISYLCHGDFYRAEKGTGQEFLNEYLNNPEVLTVIEWPEKLTKIKKPKIEIDFKILNKEKRLLKISRKN